ncbi:uncharacterized protein LOC113404275 [Vanessa tameamea]|uniref:Uncharacterized protein LOC113404275 n=1 Tax=Vanessa tameamea TaxID=334116 RepID=A0ABM4AYB2_VANTA
MAKFDLKIAMNLLPVASDDESDGNESDYKVLKPRNEKQAIKVFADGLRNRRIGTIVTARNYSSLNDAVQAALDEDSESAQSGDILTMRHNNYKNYNQYYNYRGRRNFNAGQSGNWRGRGTKRLPRVKRRNAYLNVGRESKSSRKFVQYRTHCVADVEVSVSTEDILPHSESPEVQTEVSDLRTNTILDLPTSDGELHGESANLTPEYLQALGDAINEVPQYGEDIHHDLALRWLPILRRGLPKDVREKLVTSYSIPSNCKLLKAPSLNAEISAAITDSLRQRDKKLENYQQQLGVGITSINRAVTLLLTEEDKIKAIKILSDAIRILSDLHYQDSDTRIKLLSPSLDKSILNIIDNNERDETLFGNNLSEKIKAAKTIEKQGLSIKKNIVPSKPPSVTTRPRQGNWSGPPRFPSNRGGRTGSRMRALTTATIRRTLPTGSALLPRSNHSSKQRTHQPHRYP